ncbi:MAG: WD40/YVTN/BNR-like repeat-containing protein, partial [Candidatus Sericytochromatia bacterium]
METLLTENFWRSTNGPYSEIVYALLVNYHNDHIFCGTFGSGILKSTPYGSYWSQTNISKMYIPTLIVSKDKFIFAGTRENGVFRSMDNGVTWNGTSLRKLTINCLTYDSENFIYAGTFNNGIFVSKNSGISWHQLVNNNLSC